MTTFIQKAIQSVRIPRRKFGDHQPQEDHKAFQKQLSEIAQNGMFRK